MASNDPSTDWVHSDQPAHEALVSKEIFEQTQLRLAARNQRSVRSKVRVQHPYAFKGLIFHETCRCRMQGNWNHDQAHYRCRFRAEYAIANKIDHPRMV